MDSKSSKHKSTKFLCLASNSSSRKYKRMMTSELQLQTSWPIQTYHHSIVDDFGPNFGFYETENHEFLSSINSTPECSLISSEYLYFGDDQMQNTSTVDDDSQNINALDDMCLWLCDNDQVINEVQSEMLIECDDEWSPDPTMSTSSEGQLLLVESNDVMEVEPKTGLENLLEAYADAMTMEQIELAKVIVRCISEKINPIGSVIERIAFHLFRSSENQAGEYLTQESMRNYKPAFRAFYNILPYGRFAHFSANSAILEAIPSHVESAHIVDFDIREGTQWPAVIEGMAQKGKSLTITSIKLEDHDLGFEETKKHLFNYARSFGLNLIVNVIELAHMEKVVERRKSDREFLAFNCMVGLPHMGRPRRRSQAMNFLNTARGILAKTEGIITFGDGENDDRMENSSNYSSFFSGNLTRYKALYESMEWGFPSSLNEARIAMETLFLAPFVSSLSWFQKWEEEREVVSHKVFGLKGRSMSCESISEVRELVKEGESPYGIRIGGENGNEMVLEWRGTPLVNVCAWA